MKDNIIDVQQLEFCVFECAIIDLVEKINTINKKLLEKNGYEPVENIKYRIKKPDSIMKKLKLKNLPPTYNSIIENINDVAGIRIVCSFIDDIYEIVNYLQEDENLEIIKIKDYVKEPKENGYRSFHVILKTSVGFKEYRENILVEIQIRTIAMDFWAALEHKLIYKNIFSEDAKIVGEELHDYAKNINELDCRMMKLKKEFSKGVEENETAISSGR